MPGSLSARRRKRKRREDDEDDVLRGGNEGSSDNRRRVVCLQSVFCLQISGMGVRRLHFLPKKCKVVIQAGVVRVGGHRSGP